ncbi:MAG: NAD(P)/FAD-dependent oxidoreductase, partial [Moraxellaceae bacterium]
IGREASWAGGGIVSPLYPWRYPPAVTALSREARAAYPALCKALHAATGIDPEFTPTGLLMLDAVDATEALQWSAAGDEQMQTLSTSDLAAGYPWLASHWRQGLWMPSIANVRNPRLLKALAADLVRRGVTLVTHAAVRGLQWRGPRAVAVQLADGRAYPAEVIVLAGGAWTSRLLLAGEAVPAVRPVRGQMLLYRVAPGQLPCIVLAEGRYVIPRRDGHVLCGSTLEERGFDVSVTAAARDSLQASAARLLPALARAQPVAQWAGLRPATTDGLPYIGRVEGTDNVWLNTGQFRNGLVLAPASARLLAELMTGAAPFIDPTPYRCPR